MWSSVSPRCTWCLSGNELYIEYHDKEWGVPAWDDATQFEFLILEGAQAGLSWSTVWSAVERACTSGDFRPTSAQSRLLAEPMSTTSEKYDDFLRSTGAVNVGEQTLRLTLTGRRDQQVNVLDVRPVIVRRARASRWR